MKDDNFKLRHIDFEVLDSNYYELEAEGELSSLKIIDLGSPHVEGRLHE